MRNQPWTTFMGKQVSFDTIDHQHLSNIYWYNRIVNNQTNDELDFIMDVLKERFNGQLKKYRPHIDFKQELYVLENNGNLIWNQNKTVGIISFNGIPIGEIIKPEFLK